MSHKFHGKGSGKKKTEKRMKRVWDEFVSASVCGGGGGARGNASCSKTR